MMALPRLCAESRAFPFMRGSAFRRTSHSVHGRTPPTNVEPAPARSCRADSQELRLTPTGKRVSVRGEAFTIETIAEPRAQRTTTPSLDMPSSCRGTSNLRERSIASANLGLVGKVSAAAIADFSSHLVTRRRNRADADSNDCRR